MTRINQTPWAACRCSGCPFTFDTSLSKTAHFQIQTPVVLPKCHTHGFCLVMSQTVIISGSAVKTPQFRLCFRIELTSDVSCLAPPKWLSSLDALTMRRQSLLFRIHLYDDITQAVISPPESFYSHPFRSRRTIDRLRPLCNSGPHSFWKKPP